MKEPTQQSNKERIQCACHPHSVSNQPDPTRPDPTNASIHHRKPIHMLLFKINSRSEERHCHKVTCAWVTEKITIDA